MPGALDGVKIVDLCRDLAGSYACMLLGDMGAEITKVEPVDGDPLRSHPNFQLWNRGSQSVSIDIHRAEGREVLDQLIAGSDVLLETFLAREARGLGIDYDRLRPLNTRLIYCAMPPFGESGPLADLPADDGVVSAYAGVYGDQGGEGEPPMFVYLPMVSYGTAFMAAYAISSALYTREFTGEGQKVEVPWYGGAVALQSGAIVVGPNVTYWARGIRNQRGANPVYSLYECQDGWLFISCGNVTFWNKLCIALGLEYLVEDPRYEDAPWNIPVEHRDFLFSLIGGTLRQKPRSHWLEHFAANDVPCAPANTREQFVAHPQVKHNRIIVELDDPLLGPTLQMGLPVRLEATSGAVHRPAPRLGQDTAEVLSSLGYSPRQLDSLAGQGIVTLG